MPAGLKWCLIFNPLLGLHRFPSLPVLSRLKERASLNLCKSGSHTQKRRKRCLCSWLCTHYGLLSAEGVWEDSVTEGWRESSQLQKAYTLRLLPPPSAEPQCSIMTYSPDATVSLPPRFISFFIFPIVSVLVQTETADKSSPGPRCTRVLSNPVTLCWIAAAVHWSTMGALEGKGGGGGWWWGGALLSSNHSQVRRCRCRRTDGARRCWMFPLDGMRWRRAEGGRVFMSFSCLCVSSAATCELQRSRNPPRSAARGGKWWGHKAALLAYYTRAGSLFSYDDDFHTQKENVKHE